AFFFSSLPLPFLSLLALFCIAQKLQFHMLVFSSSSSSTFISDHIIIGCKQLLFSATALLPPNLLLACPLLCLFVANNGEFVFRIGPFYPSLRFPPFSLNTGS